MDPRAFEDLIGRLLAALGFVDVEVTDYSGDGGVDVRGTLAVGGVTNVRTAIQVKRWANNVSGRTVRELRGGLSPHERGLIITTAGYTRDAFSDAETADRTPISLIDGERLVSLLVEHRIGVVWTDARILRLDAGALLEAEEVQLDESNEPAENAHPRPSRAPRRRTQRRTAKNLSTWPLPGGRGNFVQTAWMMLTYVSEAEPTLDDFVRWMIDTFERVNSPKSARSYIEVLRLARVIEARGERLVPSADGAAYLASTDSEDLYSITRENIAGFDELMARLTEGPLTVSEATALLNDALGTGWSTDAQATYRLQWLESFGKVRRVGDSYSLVSTSS
jgi:hypothetical protein